MIVTLLVLACPAVAAAQQPDGQEPDETSQPWDDGTWEPVEDDGYVPPWEPADPVAPETPDVPAQPARPAQPVLPELPPLVTGRTVAGRLARLRVDGKAAIPRGAPRRVRAVIAAANQIVGRPYVWGGGHARLFDRGYDCSGAVGYALIRAGLLGGTMVSGQFARWAAAGNGRWMTIYANRGHVYMEIAGLRFDTSPYGDWLRGGSGARWRPLVGARRGFHVRHVVGL